MRARYRDSGTALGRASAKSGLRQNLLVDLSSVALMIERALRRTSGPRRRGSGGPAQGYHEFRGYAEPSADSDFKLCVRDRDRHNNAH